MRKRAQVIFIYFLKILFKRFRNPQRHTQSIVWNRPRSTIKAKHLARRGGGTQNRHPDMIWYGGNWHFRLFSGHGNGNALKRSWRWSSSLFLDGQLSRVSIRYILYLCPLSTTKCCLGSYLYLSLYIYHISMERGVLCIHICIWQQLPKTQLRTAEAQAVALCIQLFMYRQLDLSGCLGIPQPYLSLAWVPACLSPSLSLLVEQSTCDNISKEATDRRRQQHQTEKPSSSVGNYFN